MSQSSGASIQLNPRQRWLDSLRNSILPKSLFRNWLYTVSEPSNLSICQLLAIAMFQRILVALDNSNMGEHIFEKALSIAKTNQACLLLLHVLADSEVGYVDIKHLDDHLDQWMSYKQQGLQLLKARWNTAKNVGVKTECLQTPGAPALRICEVAQAWQADLIVVGHRGLAGLKELVQGSVSNDVTHHAPCSVLTVHG
jgi:nucleotide-binding universal stress UspA family protein